MSYYIIYRIVNTFIQEEKNGLFYCTCRRSSSNCNCSKGYQKKGKHKCFCRDGNYEESGKIQKIKFSRKLRWLTNLLWGGSALLAFEHIWHGEVVPWFPFLTAVENPESAAEMLREMASTGVSMALLVTAVWGIMLFAVHSWEKKENSEPEFADNKTGCSLNS